MSENARSIEPPMPHTYTAKQVATILQIPLNEVYRGAKNGTIPGRVEFGGRVRFNGSAIDALLRGEAA